MKTSNRFLVAAVLAMAPFGLLWGMPPEASGPRVVRYQGAWFMGSGDPERMLWTSFGVSLDGLTAWCRGERPPDGSMFLFDVQDVISPSDEGVLVETFSGRNVPTLVWEALEPWDWAADWDRFWDLFCASALAAPPIAQGETHVTYTDNDVFAFAYEHDRVETWGLHARGNVTTSDGESLFFRHVGRCVWHDAPDAATLRCHTSILLH